MPRPVAAMPPTSPYANLPPRQFWKTGVRPGLWADAHDLYEPKFEITPKTRIMTAGSCFAQHIGGRLRERGYKVIDAERPPPGLRGTGARNFGYGLYSARYGNIYTVRQLLQLLREVIRDERPGDVVWERDGRYYDALRPGVEPGGLPSVQEVEIQRRDHLDRVRSAIKRADLLIFTLGLTEAWTSLEHGTVYPTAPGTIAGEFDPGRYGFVNHTAAEVYEDFERVRTMLRRRRPDIRFLLTVSPVPLTATASGNHVLPATVYSKSVLRAVAGQLATTYDDVDYFPSYELIATPFTGRTFYDDNLRTVSPDGVAAVMDVFFGAHGAAPGSASDEDAAEAIRARPYEMPSQVAERERDEAVCEDVLLEAFAPR